MNPIPEFSINVTRELGWQVGTAFCFLLALFMYRREICKEAWDVMRGIRYSARHIFAFALVCCTGIGVLLCVPVEKFSDLPPYLQVLTSGLIVGGAIAILVAATIGSWKIKDHREERRDAEIQYDSRSSFRQVYGSVGDKQPDWYHPR